MTHITIERAKLYQVLEILHYLEALNRDTQLQKMEAITAIKQALAAPVQPVACSESINKALMDAAPLLYQGGHKTESAACNAALLTLMAAQPPAAQPAMPEGWKLVPVEPTDEMLAAADEGDREYTLRNFGDVQTVMQGPYDHYVAMLAAAPEKGNTP